MGTDGCAFQRELDPALRRLCKYLGVAVLIGTRCSFGGPNGQRQWPKCAVLVLRQLPPHKKNNICERLVGPVRCRVRGGMKSYAKRECDTLA